MDQSALLEVRDKFFKDFIALQTYSEMQQLTEPLRHLNVGNIDFRIHYFDGRFAELNGNPEFVRQYYSMGLINEAYGARNLPPNGIYLEKSLFDGLIYYQHHPIYTEKMKALFHRFSFSTGIALIQHYPDHYEQFVFRFPPTQENQLMDIMIRCSSLLYKYVQHFRDNGKRLLKKAHQNLIQLPWTFKRVEQEIHPLKWIDQGKGIESFLHETACKRWYLSSLSTSEHLTGRELDVVSLLAKGKSLAQIYRQLGISEITAAYHIKNIKKKLGSRTMFDLGFKLGKIVPFELGIGGEK